MDVTTTSESERERERESESEMELPGTVVGTPKDLDLGRTRCESCDADAGVAVVMTAGSKSSVHERHAKPEPCFKAGPRLPHTEHAAIDGFAKNCAATLLRQSALRISLAKPDR